MAVIVTGPEILASSTQYRLTEAWDSADITARTKAVETVEGIWRTRNWRVGQNPFVDPAVRPMLQMALFVHAQSVLAGQFDDSIPVNIERMLFPFYASETTGERDVRQETERRNQILAMYQAGLINESALLNEFDIAGTNAPPMSERQDVRQSGRAQALAMYNNCLLYTSPSPRD